MAEIEQIIAAIILSLALQGIVTSTPTAKTSDLVLDIFKLVDTARCELDYTASINWFAMKELEEGPW